MSTKDYYDTYWTDEGFNPTGARNVPFERLLADHVRPGTRVLDVGCGDGSTNGLVLAGLGADYVGVDISESAIASARARGLRAERIDDATQLPFEDGAFEVVVCAEVLEHLFEPQVALAEIRRVLAPGGTLMLSVPNSAYWRRRLDLAVLGRWNPMGDDRSTSEPWRDPHIRFFTVPILGTLLRQAGFEVRELGGHGGTVAGDLPGVRGLVRASGWTAPDWRPHPLYGALERRLPSLLAYRLSAVARRP